MGPNSLDTYKPRRLASLRQRSPDQTASAQARNIATTGTKSLPSVLRVMGDCKRTRILVSNPLWVKDRATADFLAEVVSTNRTSPWARSEAQLHFVAAMVSHRI